MSGQSKIEPARSPAALLAAAAMLATFASGCGYVAPAVVAVALSGDSGGGAGGGGTVGGGLAAEISDVPRASAAPDIQPVLVRLADPGSLQAALRLEFREGGPFAAAQLARVRRDSPTGPVVFEGPFTETPLLESTPQGVFYVLEWLWQQGLGPTPRTDVALQLVIARTETGLGSGVAFTTEGRKVGNEPPALASVEVVGRSGTVVVRYALSDSSLDRCNVEARFRADADPLRALAPFDSAALVGIAAATTPAPLDFLWDTTGPTQVGARRSSVVVELVAVDEGGLRSPTGTATAVTIENDTPPRALVAPIPRATSGTATAIYVLVDLEGQPTDVAVTYELEDLSKSGVATAAGGDGILGLATAPSGAGHFFVWDYAFDLQSTAAARARVTVRPTAASGQAGTAAVSVGNDAPTVAFGAVAPDLTDDATIPFTLADSSDDLAQVVLEYSTDGGQSFFAAATGSQTVGLAPGARSIVWRTRDDLPAADGETAILRLRATDGLPGGIGTPVTTSAQVDNVGNRPPVATVATPARTAAGDVTISFTVADPDGDAVDVAVAFAFEGSGSFTLATPGPGGSGTTGLPATASPTAYTFVWDADGQLPGMLPARVRVRVTPSDAGPAGAAAESGLFVVGNTAPATAFTSAFPGTQRGAIEVPFTLEDAESDPAAVSLAFSTNGGGSFTPALTAGATSGLGTGGPGAPAARTIFWRSDLDLPSAAGTPVVLRLSANDGLAGGAGAPATAAATVDNAVGLPPSVVVGDVPRTATGFATIPHTLFDADSPSATIAVHFSLDGVNFDPADEGPGGDGLGPLGASASGAPHTFVWDYGTALGTGARAGVIFRVTPSDAGGPGAPAFSAPLSIGNDAPVILTGAAEPIAIGGPERPAIRFTLADASADLCSVTATYSFDGIDFFEIPPAQIVAGSLSGLPATPTGRVFDFAWDAAQALGGPPPSDVFVRLVPSDPFATGVEAVTALFSAGAAATLANRPPSVAILPIARSTSGKLLFVYELFDPDLDPINFIYDPADVTVEFSTNGGLSYVDALESTDLADGSEGTVGLGTDPFGFAHVFVWDYGAQIGPGGRPDVRIRITPAPSDPLVSGPGAPVVTPPFVLGNDGPEIVGAVEVVGSALAPTVRFSLRDSTGDPASVRASFRRPPAPDALPIAGTFVSSGTLEGLPAPAAAASHEIVWEAAAQIGEAASVVVDIVAFDAFGAASTTVTSSLFAIAGPGTITLTAIRPAEGPAAGGTLVEIDGAGFTLDGPVAVRIGGAAVDPADVEVRSDDLIVARTPAGLLGPRDVEVDVGATPLALAGGFTYRPIVRFAVVASTVAETAPSFPVELQLVGDGVTALPAASVTVADTGLGSAIPARDYAAFSATPVAFAGGGTGPETQTVLVSILPDLFREPDETVALELASPSGALLAELAAHAVRIADDDARVVAFEASTDRPFVDQTDVGLSWLVDVPPGPPPPIALDPGNNPVPPIGGASVLPFSPGPAAVDPRQGYRLGVQRADGLEAAQLELFRIIDTAGTDAGFGLAGLSDGGAIVAGRYQSSTGPTVAPGVTLPGSSNTALLVVRYRADGSVVWATAATVTGTGNQIIAAVGGAVRAYPDGGAVVTGIFQAGAARFFDAGALGGPGTILPGGDAVNEVYVVRYHPDGRVAWVRKAASPTTASANDISSGVAACLDGGALVCGEFRGTITFGAGEPGETSFTAEGGTSPTDMFVARYRPDGSFAWARRTRNGSNRGERALGVAALPDGGALACGAFGGANVTFSAGTEPNVAFSVGAPVNSNDDAFVARYRADGGLVTVTALQGAGTSDTALGIAALPDGSSFVSGAFSGTLDFGSSILLGPTSGAGLYGFVARFNAGLTAQWARGIASTGNTQANAAAALADGSVAVAGDFRGTATFSAPAQTGTVVLSSVNSSDADAFLARYEGDGRVRWAVRAGSPSNDEGLFDVGGSPDGAVWATGYLASSVAGLGTPITIAPGEPNEALVSTGGTVACVTVRYEPISYRTIEMRPQGLAWTRVFESTGESVVAATAGALDGDVAAVGEFSGTVTIDAATSFTADSFSDAIVTRYGPDGSLDWASPVGGTGHASGGGVATLLDGKTIAAGRFLAGTALFGREGESFRPELTPDPTSNDVWVARYKEGGEVDWAIGFGGPLNEQAVALAATPDGGAIVAISGVTIAARVDGAGSILWTIATDGSASPGEVETFPDGGAVIVGTFDGQPTFGVGLPSATTPAQPAGGNDAFALRVDRDGAIVWLRTIGGASADMGLGVAAFPDGSAVVTGSFLGDVVFPDGLMRTSGEGDQDAFIVRYDASGAAAHVVTVGPGDVRAIEAAALPDLGVAVSGTIATTATFPSGESFSAGGAGSGDAFVARFARDGTFLWVRTAGGAGAIEASEAAGLTDRSVAIGGFLTGSVTFGALEPNVQPVSVTGGKGFVAKYYPYE